MSDSTSSTDINHVSDTALWVATYRALETERPDALFQDPFARRLIGDRGEKIAAKMQQSRYTQWSVVIRTCIIDDYIRKLIAEGVDTVINLGAGLDTRPYRMQLPADFRWIEVDYPHMMARKENLLRDEKPTCQLERVSLDLADRQKRQTFLAEAAGRTKKALILTEGVIPYLSEAQVAELAEDLQLHPSFQFWLVEYFANHVYRYLRGKKRMQQMRNAPFQFFPLDWYGFFEKHGWKALETRYLSKESLKLGRTPPMPWFGRIAIFFMPESKKNFLREFTGYILLGPKESRKV